MDKQIENLKEYIVVYAQLRVDKQTENLKEYIVYAQLRVEESRKEWHEAINEGDSVRAAHLDAKLNYFEGRLDGLQTALEVLVGRE